MTDVYYIPMYARREREDGIPETGEGERWRLEDKIEWGRIR